MSECNTLRRKSVPYKLLLSDIDGILKHTDHPETGDLEDYVEDTLDTPDDQGGERSEYELIGMEVPFEGTREGTESLPSTSSTGTPSSRSLL
jgi:hypothetical protein